MTNYQFPRTVLAAATLALATAGVAVLLPAAPAAGQYRDGYNRRNDAAVAAARARMNAAREQLQSVLLQKRAEFEARPEVIEAKSDLEQKKAAYEVERSRIVETLKEQDPKYAEMAKRAAAIQEQIDKQSPGSVMSAGGGAAAESGPAGVATGGDGSGAVADREKGKTPKPDDPTTGPAAAAAKVDAATRRSGGPAGESPEQKADDRDAGVGGGATGGQPAAEPTTTAVPGSDKDDIDSFLNNDNGTATAANPAQVAQAKESLDLKQQTDAIEDAAILKDEKAVAAKNAYEAAAKKTEVFPTKLRAEILDDPKYQQAQQQLNQAREQLAAASAY